MRATLRKLGQVCLLFGVIVGIQLVNYLQVNSQTSEPTPQSTTLQIPPVDSARVLFLRDSLLLDSLLRADTLQPQLRLGISSGIGFSTATVTSLPISPKPLAGLYAGIRTELEFAHPLYFGFELLYTQRGASSEYRTANGSMLTENYAFDYLNTPLFFKLLLPLRSKLSASISFGATPGFLLSSHQVLSFIEIDTVLDINSGIERFDFGLDFRLGMEYALNPKWSITAEGAYLHGLQNIFIVSAINDPRSWKGRNTMFSFGMLYQIQRSIRRS